MLENVNVERGQATFNGEDVNFDLVLSGSSLVDVNVIAVIATPETPNFLNINREFEKQAKQALKQYFKQFSVKVSLAPCNGF